MILGFILGAVLAIAWERADARIDGLEELSSELTCSTSYIDGLSNAAATALLERWRRLAGSQAKVALLPATVSLEQRLRDVALELALADETEKAVVASNTSGSDGRMRISEVGGAPRATNGDSVLVAGEVPGGESAGEGIALASDLTVLVVEQGTRRKDVRKALEALRQFAIEPAWALLISRGSARKVHMRVKSAPAHSRAAVKSADVV